MRKNESGAREKREQKKKESQLMRSIAYVQLIFITLVFPQACLLSGGGGLL